MPDIRELRTSQVRIYATDALPFNRLRQSKAVSMLQESMDFSPSQSMFPFPDGILQTQPIAMASGSCNGVFIEKLVVEERKMVLTILGSTEQADAIQEELIKAITQATGTGDPDLSPLAVSHESNCVAKLNFQIPKLLAGSPMEAIPEMFKNQVHPKNSSIDVVPASVSFLVRYSHISRELQERKINLVDKEIKIELRAKTAVNDQIYSVSAPATTGELIELVRQIEDKVG